MDECLNDAAGISSDRQFLQLRLKFAQQVPRLVGEANRLLAPIVSGARHDLQQIQFFEAVDQLATRAITAEAVHAIRHDEARDGTGVVLRGDQQRRRQAEMFHRTC